LYFSILTRRLNPKYAPRNVRGTDMPNHRPRRASRVVNGTAAEELFAHKTRFKMKKSPKTTLKKKHPLKNIHFIERRDGKTAYTQDIEVQSEGHLPSIGHHPSFCTAAKRHIRQKFPNRRRGTKRRSSKLLG
jgi:hypothetical protein